MKPSAYWIVICTLLVPQASVFSQSVVLDSIQVERITKTCQLWGHIKYFHPYLSNDVIDWEGAFTNSIEGVIEAKNSEDFGKAVQKMLDQLHDPATKVLTQMSKHALDDTLKYPVIAFIQDSILLVTVKDYNDLEDFNYASAQFSGLTQKIPISKGVIFDIRSPQNLGSLKDIYHIILLIWNEA